MGSTIRGSTLLLLSAALLASGCSSPAAPALAPTQAPAATASPAPTAAPTPAPTSTPAPELSPTPTPQLAALFYYSRAVRLLEIGEHDEAIAAFGLVIRRLPDFAQAYHGRGLAYYHKQRLGLALDDFNQAIRLKPDFADAHRDRATVHKDQGETQKAIEDLEKALTLYDPVRDAQKLAEVKALLDQLRR